MHAAESSDLSSFDAAIDFVRSQADVMPGFPVLEHSSWEGKAFVQQDIAAAIFRISKPELWRATYHEKMRTRRSFYVSERINILGFSHRHKHLASSQHPKSPPECQGESAGFSISEKFKITAEPLELCKPPLAIPERRIRYLVQQLLYIPQDQLSAAKTCHYTH